MIERIYIDGFRCFTNLEFKPARINLIFGANGSGKSSFMDVFDRIIGLVIEGQDVSDLFSDSDLTKWGACQQQHFEIDLRVGKHTFCYVVELGSKSAGGGMVLRQERVSIGSTVLFRFEDGEVHLYSNEGREGTSFAFRGNRSFLAGIEERPETTLLMGFLVRLRSLCSYKLEPARMESVTQDEHQSLLKDGANFSSWYRHLSQEHAGDIPQFFAQLAEALPGFKALVLKGAGKQGRTRDLVVQMQAAGKAQYEVEFDDISDGQRALIVLYSLLLDIGSMPRSVLLDEPENYVGLSELQPWLQRLDDALGDEGQLFLVSHHPEVIDFMAAETPILFWRPGGGPVRVKAVEFDREAGLKASEQVARGLLHE